MEAAWGGPFSSLPYSLTTTMHTYPESTNPKDQGHSLYMHVDEFTRANACAHTHTHDYAIFYMSWFSCESIQAFEPKAACDPTSLATNVARSSALQASSSCSKSLAYTLQIQTGFPPPKMQRRSVDDALQALLVDHEKATSGLSSNQVANNNLSKATRTNRLSNT